MVEEEISALLNDYVLEANGIYSGTTFDGGYTGYNFRIDRIRVSGSCLLLRLPSHHSVGWVIADYACENPWRLYDRANDGGETIE